MGTYDIKEGEDIYEKVLLSIGCGPIYECPEIAECFNKIKMFGSELYEHSVNVAFLSTLLGFKLYKSEKDRIDLFTAALLHDFGKLFIAKGILNKPDLLTLDERKTIELHSIVGFFYLNKDTNLSDEVLAAVLDHHEKLDGTGYGQGKRDNEICPYAKIIMIADVYDAMASDRVYRKKINRNIVYEYLSNQAGKHFDEYLIKTFIDLTLHLDLDAMEERFRKALGRHLSTLVINNVS